MKRPDVIATNIADFTSPVGQQAFAKFWQDNKDTARYTTGAIFPKQLKIKLDTQKFLEKPEQKSEAELYKELVLADFFRLTDYAKFNPQAQTIVQQKKEPQERKAYQANIAQLKQQLNALVNFFVRTGHEPTMLKPQEQLHATRVKFNLVRHYESKHKYSFNDYQVIAKIHGEIVEYLVFSIAENYFKEPQNELSLENLKTLIKNDAKYRNDDENINNANGEYDKYKAALRLLTKIPGQRIYGSEFGDNHSLAIKHIHASMHDDIPLVPYMCLQWVAATDPDMPLNEIVVSSAKDSAIQTLLKNNAPEEAITKLRQQSNAEYARTIIPDIIKESKESFATILGDICRTHSTDPNNLIKGDDVPSCMAGINGRLSRINKYNTLALIVNPGLILDKIIRTFILAQYNSLPEIQQTYIGTAMDETLSCISSFFHDEDMPLKANIEKAVNDFLISLEAPKTKNQLNQLIDANLRNLITINIGDSTNTQKVIDLYYTIAVKSLKDGEKYLHETFISQSIVNKLAQPATDLLKQLKISEFFPLANTVIELDCLNNMIDSALKTLRLDGELITEGTFEKVITKLRANAIYESTPDYCIIPFARSCHDNSNQYSRVKIPADGNCMLSAVINGCAQAKVALPAGIKNIETLRECLVQEMRTMYKQICDYINLTLSKNNLIDKYSLTGWQTNPGFITIVPYDELPDAERERFRSGTEIVGKFQAAAVDHDEYYPNDQVQGNFDKYLDRLSSNGIWCGELELGFLSMICRIQIITHSAVNANLHIVGPNSVPNIHLHHTGSHYELLCTKNNYNPSLVIGAIDKISFVPANKPSTEPHKNLVINQDIKQEWSKAYNIYKSSQCCLEQQINYSKQQQLAAQQLIEQKQQDYIVESDRVSAAIVAIQIERRDIDKTRDKVKDILWHAGNDFDAASFAKDDADRSATESIEAAKVAGIALNKYRVAAVVFEKDMANKDYYVINNQPPYSQGYDAAHYAIELEKLTKAVNQSKEEYERCLSAMNIADLKAKQLATTAEFFSGRAVTVARDMADAEHKKVTAATELDRLNAEFARLSAELARLNKRSSLLDRVLRRPGY